MNPDILPNPKYLTELVRQISAAKKSVIAVNYLAEHPCTHDGANTAAVTRNRAVVKGRDLQASSNLLIIDKI